MANVFEALTIDKINNNDMIVAKSIIQTYCPDLLSTNSHDGFKSNDSNKGIITMVALAKQLNMPLLTWIIDVHHRMIIHDNYEHAQLNEDNKESPLDPLMDFLTNPQYKVNLKQYYNLLNQEGYNDIEMMQELHDDDLQKFGINEKSHRMQIIRGVTILKAINEGYNSKLQCIIDRCLDYIPHKPYNIDITNIQLMNHLRSKSPRLYDIFMHTVPTVRRQLFKYPITSLTQTQPLLFQYDDSLQDYYDITKGINSILQHNIGKTFIVINNTLTLPFQLDVWIIPKSVSTTGDVSIYLVQGYCEKHSTHIPPELFQIMHTYLGDIELGIGDIKKKLDENEKVGRIEKVKYIRRQCDYTPITYLIKDALSINGLDKISSGRHVLIIDRRENGVYN
eukprot:CAMPEP_0201569834 /NCGR_PEP_ID=MMETSP0190_2-20130828/11744_1 /ASSEMBLY_ACC=CAM_ASM_000263 /TAXON_ID=37353 /ORGANISM="Rosalina sp." /LENGTH=392 /DNA_ID=CAMNT_0047992625 /DNA_START=20 /DNA_END=1195 /DNA_ORIENTATION=+